MFLRLRSRYIIITRSVGKCNLRMRKTEMEIEAMKECLAHYVVVKLGMPGLNAKPKDVVFMEKW